MLPFCGISVMQSLTLFLLEAECVCFYVTASRSFSGEVFCSYPLTEAAKYLFAGFIAKALDICPNQNICSFQLVSEQIPTTLVNIV
jgi:hypothetical protein